MPGERTARTTAMPGERTARAPVRGRLHPEARAKRASKEGRPERNNHPGRRLPALAAGLLALSVGFGAGPGPALADGDIGAARAIVRQHCLDCHVVPGMAAGRLEPLEQAPAFQEIADNPSRWTEDRLRGFLRQPHRPMAGLVLSSGDVDNLIAFFRDLRGTAAVH